MNGNKRIKFGIEFIIVDDFRTYKFHLIFVISLSFATAMLETKLVIVFDAHLFVT